MIRRTLFMKAIGKLKPEINVTGIVPTAENFPDANAQRPGDIFYAKNGKSIMNRFAHGAFQSGSFLFQGFSLRYRDERLRIPLNRRA